MTILRNTLPATASMGTLLVMQGINQVVRPQVSKDGQPLATRAERLKAAHESAKNAATSVPFMGAVFYPTRRIFDLQAAHSYYAKQSGLSIGKQILRTTGVRGLYAGFVPSSVIAATICYSDVLVNEYLRADQSKQSYGIYCFNAVMAVTISAIIRCGITPLDRVKTEMTTKASVTGLFEKCIAVYNMGPSRTYKGAVPNAVAALKVIPWFSTVFAFEQYYGPGSRWTWKTHLACASVATVCAETFIQPARVFKTVLMSEDSASPNKTSRQIVRETVAKYGKDVLKRGYWIRLGGSWLQNIVYLGLWKSMDDIKAKVMAKEESSTDV